MTGTTVEKDKNAGVGPGAGSGSAAQAVGNFGLKLDPQTLINKLTETLQSQLQFGQNLATIFNAGFSQRQASCMRGVARLMPTREAVATTC